MSQNQGGDALAGGAVRFQFQPAGSKVSQQRWDDIFADFDPEAYKKSEAQITGGEKEVVRTGK